MMMAAVTLTFLVGWLVVPQEEEYGGAAY